VRRRASAAAITALDIFFQRSAGRTLVASHRRTRVPGGCQFVRVFHYPVLDAEVLPATGGQGPGPSRPT